MAPRPPDDDRMPVPADVRGRPPIAPGPPDDDCPPATVDVRLLPSAAVAWLAALLVVRVPSHVALVVAAVCVACVVAAGAVAVRRRGAPAPTRRAPDQRPDARSAAGWRAPRGRLAPVVALCLVVAAVVLGAGASQTAVRADGLLPRLAQDGLVGRVEGTVVGEPTVLSPAWPGAPVRVRSLVAVDRVTAGGRVSGAVGQVLVLGPSSWSDVPSGARVAAAGPLRPTEPGRRTVAVLLSGGAPVVLSVPPTSETAAARFRDGVRTLAATLPGDAGALFAGVTIGDTAEITDELTDALRAAGLTHVTAVSGAHFSLVAALVLALTSAVRVPRPVRVGLTVAAMAAMVLVVHPSPSVQRAATMGLVAMLGVLLGRPHRAPAALGATVVLLLVVDPWLAGEVGFVLSVLATGALVLLGGPLADRWAEALGRPVATALALPVAAQLVCAPVVLLLTPAVSLYAVPANVLAAPAVAPATVIGLTAGCVAPWWPAGAEVLALGAGAACWWIAAVGRVAAAAPGAQVAWLAGLPGAVVLAAAGVCVVRLLVGRRGRSSGCG